LPLVVSGAVVKLEPRQSGAAAPDGGSLFSGGFANLMLPKKKAMKVEDIKTVLGIPGAKRIRMVYGPYKLGAANGTAKLGNGKSMDKGGTAYQYMIDEDFPRDVMVLEASSEVQGDNFKSAGTEQGIYNHHNVFMDFTATIDNAYTCENTKAPPPFPFSVLMAGATEVGSLRYAATQGNIKTGYHLKKERLVLNMIDVVNYNNVEKNVYISAEMEFLPSNFADYIDTRQHRVDPGLCGGPDGAQIHPPKGVSKFSVNSTGIIAARDGYIVNMRGHLHDGGVNLILKINDKIVCNSQTTYGGPGHVGKTSDGKVWETIQKTSSCDDPVKIKKGDKVYMEANYDLDLHPSREQGGGHGGMGGMRVVTNTRTAADGDDGAEQMALFITHFAPTGPA